MKIKQLLHAQPGLLRTAVLALLIGWVSPGIHASDGEPTAGVATFSDILALEARSPSLEAAYGPDLLQTTLLFESAGSTKRQVVLIHGGCWSNQYTRAHITPLASALADAGFTVWVPEYRRVGDVGGGWPGTYQDVAAAINYVSGKMRTLPIVIGHSAGGHLALLAAADPAVALAGVIGLAAITDLSVYSQQDGSCPAMAQELMGASYTDSPEHYRAASVLSSAFTVPAYLIAGSLDEIVGDDQLAGFGSNQIVRIPDAGHFDLIHPESTAFNKLVDILLSLSQ
jgi:acetyl esterase/lipase